MKKSVIVFQLYISVLLTAIKSLPQQDFVFNQFDNEDIEYINPTTEPYQIQGHVDSKTRNESVAPIDGPFYVVFGSPGCKRDAECIQCSSDAFCLLGNCAVDCSKICGQNADCSFQPVPTCKFDRNSLQCSCPHGYEGDPYKLCQPTSDILGRFQLSENLNNLVHQHTEIGLIEYQSSIHDFGQALFSQILQDFPTNVVFSPLSLHTALGMLTSGAANNTTTQVELLSALGRSQNIQWLETLYQNLLRDYEANVAGALYIGNAIWVKDSIMSTISGKYLERLDSIYKAQVKSLNSEGDSAGEVNAWVKQITHGRIEKLIDNLRPQTVLLLTNAIYFKQSWTVAFTPVNAPIEFKLADGSSIHVPMMARSSYEFVLARFRFDQILPHITFIAISIPYEFQNGRFEMVVVMPESEKGISFLGDFIANMSPSENIFDVIVSSLKAAEMNNEEKTLIMPIFSVHSSIPADKYLRKIGIHEAFEKTANFMPISPDVFVEKVSHVATVEVTPDGTVGAAATGIEVAPLSGLIDSPPEVIINKPFLFIIRDTKKKTALFVGKVSDPSK